MELNDLLPNPGHRRFVEWLVTPPKERVPSTQKELAEELGVAERTLRHWKVRDDVRRAWEGLSKEVIGDPSRVQEVLEEMRRLALDSESRNQVSAAKLYLEAVEAIKPPDKNTVVLREKDLADFTDAELEQAIVDRWATEVVEQP